MINVHGHALFLNGNDGNGYWATLMVGQFVRPPDFAALIVYLFVPEDCVDVLGKVRGKTSTICLTSPAVRRQHSDADYQKQESHGRTDRGQARVK